MEWLSVVIIAAVIFCAPVLFMWYRRRKAERSYLRKIDRRVKNELLSREGSNVIGGEVMAMVKGYILRSHALTLVIAEVLFIGVSVLGAGEVLPIVVALPVIATAVSAAVKLHGLSDGHELIKVKAFVFRKSSWEISAAYYDMQRLEYRVFTQGTLFENIDSSVQAGKYVNLIVRRKENGYHVVRVLMF